jgi:hypothetical protein
MMPKVLLIYQSEGKSDTVTLRIYSEKLIVNKKIQIQEETEVDHLYLPSPELERKVNESVQNHEISVSFK